MGLQETIEGLHIRHPQEVPLQHNAALILKIGEENATCEDKLQPMQILWHTSEENFLLMKRKKKTVKLKIRNLHALPILR